MFDDKNDDRHLFRCQRTIVTSDGQVSVLNVVVYFLVYVLDLFTKFVIITKINRHSSIKSNFR